MLEIKLAEFPQLETSRLVLRELRSSDARALFGVRSHPDVVKFLDRAPDADQAATERLMEVVKNACASGDSVHWCITRRGSDELIGSIMFWRFEKQNYRAELGYMLHPSCWRQGIMAEALEAVLRFGFDKLNLHSVEANTSAKNVASQQLLLKFGFVQEAHFRENWYYDGKFLDSLVFSKLTDRDA